jgi:serine/threonine protein kinase
VAKIYHRNKLTDARKDKLLYMVSHNPNIPNLAWPCAMLYTQNQDWVGYLMPKAPGKALEDVVFHPGVNWKNIKNMGWSRRHLAQVGANIAHTFMQMHKQDMLMGDVNPRNIMVDQDCSVYFVDCDSYQFGDYECPVGKPDYTPPEVHVRMRAEGITEYRYTRTEYNEVYSLAVLLFSVLLPGKAPYAARNAGYDDVVDAVIAGYFPYPYGGDENAVPKGNMLAPAGVFRNIWSHMTHQMKTHFYETFTQTGGGRRNAQQWEQALREYIRQIELNHSTDELEPNGYKDTSREGDDSSTKMIDLVCSHCGQKFNIAEDVYQRRKGKLEQDFCGKHYEIMRNFRTRTTDVSCSKCGKTYQTTLYDLFVRDSNNTPPMCDDCENTTVICADCGIEFRRNRQQVEDLRRKGISILCRDCHARRKNG